MKQRVIDFINKIIRHTDWYNKTFWNGATKFWSQNQFGLDVVNLGSGAGVHAFNYDGMRIKGANWALGPQSLVHDYNILKNYFSYIKDGGYVIITICPFSGLISKYGKEHNFKYYSFLHPATIQNFEESERQRALRIRQNPFGEMPLYSIKKTVLEFFEKTKHKVIHSERTSLEKSAIQMMNGWKKQFDIKDLSEVVSIQHAREIVIRRQTLLEMVRFCKERSLKPVVVVPVMHKSLSSMFPDIFNINYIDRLLEDVDAPILNFMNDDIGINDNYFSTALFLNKEGAKEFTKVVLNRIRDMENG